MAGSSNAKQILIPLGFVAFMVESRSMSVSALRPRLERNEMLYNTKWYTTKDDMKLSIILYTLSYGVMLMTRKIYLGFLRQIERTIGTQVLI